jgi:TolB protein
MHNRRRTKFVWQSIVSSVVLLLFFCTGCLSGGENSWRHYTSGGNYPARTPSMSPDGSVIVFSSPRTGNGDIYQIKSDGSGSVQLTNSPVFETDPIFSPDGSTIAFLREADGCRHIWLMNRDGTDQRQLTSGKVLDDMGAFSPNGSELLFLRSPLPTGLGRLVEDFSVNVRSKQVRKLEAFPEYSPDGKHVAYSTFSEVKERFEIWIMDSDGSDKHFLAVGNSPRFSSDGGMILYQTKSDDAGPGGLWKTIAIDGSSDRELGRMTDAVFSPDGKHIVYQSPSYKRELWKMDRDGTNRIRLVAPTGYIDFLRPCRPGFILKIVTDDRVGDIYLIDTGTWKVNRVTNMK